MRQLLAFLLLPFALSACVPTLIAGATETGVSIAEERSVGKKMDDTVIYAAIQKLYLEEKKNNLLIDVTVNVRHGRVMLTGTVPQQFIAAKAVELAWKAENVREVINELRVGEDPSIGDTANDMLIKKNLESRLFLTKDVWVINYSIDVQLGTAYLLGFTKDRPEFNRVMNVSRTTKGVKRVVNHLQILNENPEPTRGDAVPSAPSFTPAAASFPNNQDTVGTVSMDAVSATPLPAAGSSGRGY